MIRQKVYSISRVQHLRIVNNRTIKRETKRRRRTRRSERLMLRYCEENFYLIKPIKFLFRKYSLFEFSGFILIFLFHDPGV